jgi:hypothetical protein
MTISSVDGESVTLYWSVEKAESCNIQPNDEIGPVACSGSLTFTPTKAFQSYVLWARNGTVEKSVASGIGITVRYPDVAYVVTTSAAPRVSLVTYAGPGGSTLQAANATPWLRT